MRIVRLANFVTPRSGGLRTALQALGEGYLAATKNTRWVLDRSTDLVANLIGLSIVEFWHGARGLTARLDQRITGDIRSTIEAIEGPTEEVAAV